MRTMKQTLIVAVALVGLVVQSQATIIEQSRWHFGEAGSMSGSLALDSVATDGELNNMNNAFNNTVLTATPPPLGGSTAYQHFTGASIVSGTFEFGGGAGLQQNVPADNYGMELWARATDLTLTAYRVVMGLDDATGAFEIGMRLDGGVMKWYAARGGAAYIATDGAVAANTWYDLALVRDGGVSKFYVNGVLIGSDATAPANGAQSDIHFGLQHTSGGRNFIGDMDEPRFFTFAAGQFNANSDLYVGVPEPSSVILMALGGGLLFWRRNRQA